MSLLMLFSGLEIEAQKCTYSEDVSEPRQEPSAVWCSNLVGKGHLVLSLHVCKGVRTPWNLPCDEWAMLAEYQNTVEVPKQGAR